ncbi:MAG: PDZ domain-containing protein [Candidatus Yanofskybacteria bacterium]|nr:PDZ domain-containing protein [Candidatus Yanofskybacteria bacterium]
MKNIARVWILSFAFVFIFSSQLVFSQTPASPPQEQSSVHSAGPVPIDPEQRRQEILRFINSIKDPEVIQKLFNFFVVHREVLDHFVDPKTPAEVLDQAMIGMVEGLDPYSHLFIGEKAEALYKDFTGENDYAGVGMTIMNLRKNVFITEVFDNSPAAKAGVQAGDSLLRVCVKESDCKNVYGLDSLEIASLIKGKEGTPVILEIRSPRLQKPKKFTIIRRRVVVESVTYREIVGNIAYIKVRAFLPDEEVVSRFKGALNKAADRKLIIDLRDNGGGSLQAVNRMVGFLIGPNKLLMSIRGRSRTIPVMTPKGTRYKFPKIVVLVNNFSASASEIMAGSLKHYKTATIMGVRTFGKATVQTYLSLDTSSENLVYGSRLIMGITTERYFLPDGTSITDIGVQPNIEVEQSDDFQLFQGMTRRDTQFWAALTLLKKK